MKFFTERKSSKRNIDTPGHFTKPNAGERQLGKSEEQRLDYKVVEYRSRAYKAALRLNIDMQLSAYLSSKGNNHAQHK